MFYIKRFMRIMIFAVSVAAISASCGRETANREQEISGNVPEEEETDIGTSETMQMESEGAEETKEDEMKQRFGENCITDQVFEVELSEYSGKVFFVPFAPSEDKPYYHIKIIQNEEVLTEIEAYIPDSLTGGEFDSLDAVSFYDVNYDDNTDIVMIETYGDKSFAAIYYGYDGEEDYEKYFMIQERLSENITDQAEALSVPGIRSLLSDGKKNGEFSDYREAYYAVSRLCKLEGIEETGYDLIYFDEDDIPELAAGVDGYYTSLYTYADGKIYTLMDQWAYGAMGNSGYEYSPGKNSLRNYNADYAGAILYTTYMKIGSQYSMDTVVQIKSYNFDDVNENGVPDEDEMDSMGYYGVTYIDGKEVSQEECAIYDVGGYEYLRTTMSWKELQSELQNGGSQ